MILKAADFRQRRFVQALASIPTSTVDLIREIRRRGLRAGLISNCDASEIAAWNHSLLKEAFDAEVFSCEVGFVKPEPDIYFECLKRLNLTASQCVFVGDGGSNELVGARLVGMRSVLFSGVIKHMWPERIPSLVQGVDAHIESLEELLSLPMLWAPASRQGVAQGEA